MRVPYERAKATTSPIFFAATARNISSMLPGVKITTNLVGSAVVICRSNARLVCCEKCAASHRVVEIRTPWRAPSSRLRSTTADRQSASGYLQVSQPGLDVAALVVSLESGEGDVD